MLRHARLHDYESCADRADTPWSQAQKGCQQRPLRGNFGLALAATSCNLLRAAGSLASLAYAKARGATVRRDLIDVAARTSRHGRGSITIHLPEGWPREQEWTGLFHAATGPPAAAA